MTTHPFSENVFLWTCIWQSTVCITAGLIVSFALKRWPARAHRVLFLAIIAAVLVPLLSAFVKHYELGIFVAEPPVVEPRVEARATPNEYATTTAVPVEDFKPGLGRTGEYSAPTVAIPSESIEIAWDRVAIWAWISASLILAGRLVVTFVMGFRLLNRAKSLDNNNIREAARTAKTRLGVDEVVGAYSSDKVCGTVIWCWGKRPVLLLPSDVCQSDDRLDWVSVLCHELAHWKRRDHISSLLAELAVCVLPWNPLLWWAKRRLVRLSEQACDDWVLASGQQGTDYAESLLDLQPQRQIAFAPAVVSSKNGLATRAQRILQDKCGNPRTGVRWAVAVTVVATVLAITAAFAQTRPIRTAESPLVKCSGKVLDERGHPLAGAKVAAYKMVDDGVAGNIKLLNVGRVATKEDGAFVFDTEPRPKFGGHTMNGYIVAVNKGMALGWAEWDMYGDKQVTIELGEPAKLEGTIVDEAGRPIGGAEVRANLFRKNPKTITDWLPGITPLDSLVVKSDNDGHFQFNNIPADSYVDLLITAPGRATTYTYQWGPPPRFKGGVGPRFKAGQTDIKLVLPVEARIEGKVVDRNTGQGVAGAELAVVATFSPAFFYRFVCVSSEDGAFNVGGLQTGEYLIRTGPLYGGFPRMNLMAESGKTTSDVIIKWPHVGQSRPASTLTTDSKPNQIGPRITFENETHDFGEVAPGSKNTCEFRFTNTGNAPLIITRVRSSCSCAAAVPQKKKQYAAGESGTIKVTYSASKHPRKVTQSLTVLSNDPTRPKVKLTIKATVVFIIQPDPEYFQLSLKAENAGCPQITLTSTDNQPFAITSFESPGQLITAQFEPTREATTFVIEPKVDTTRLKGDSRGMIKIGVTHPKSNTVTIRFSILPRFKISPQLLIIRNAEPQKPVTKQLSITSNYDEDLEIESTSSKNNLVRLLNQEKINNRHKLELQILPPVPEGKERFFTDVFHVKIKGGEELSINCRGSYPKKK